MDLRRTSMYLLMVMLCINAWSMMMYSAGIGPATPEPSLNQTEWEQNTDLNQTLSSYSWGDVAYSDFVFGLLTWLGVVWGLIAGFPTLMSSAGVPSFIVDPLYLVWGFMWFTVGLLYYIGGRDV